MENRLFLLQEENPFNELRDSILSDKDVTKPEEYRGKVTLTQLNAYSGELRAEALTNFKTIKVAKDGTASETNLAKLLIELQQGGGLEDAVEESKIEVDSDKAEAKLRKDLTDLSIKVDGLHNDYEVALTGRSEYDIIEAVISTDAKWQESAITADGEARAFVSEEARFSYGSDIHVLLNGVIVTEEDGSILYAEDDGEGNMSKAYGFEFNVAPSVGDIVEFNFSSSVETDGAAHKLALKAVNGQEEDAKAGYETWVFDRKAEEQAMNASLNKLNEEIAPLRTAHINAEAAMAKAQKMYDELMTKIEKGEEVVTISEVTKATGELTDSIEGERDAYLDVAKKQSEIDIITANIGELSRVGQEQEVIRSAANQDFKDFNDETSAIIAALNNVSDRHNAIANPSTGGPV